MKRSFCYRGYEISAEDGRYQAKSLDGDEFLMTSNHLLRVLRSVDALWVATEELLDQGISKSQAPSWIRDLLEKPIIHIDLDLADGVAPSSNPAGVIQFRRRFSIMASGPSAATA
ncbi:hypothetical protein [Bradyrhizobium sp. SZCCHNPS1003]|uniref:hypothetical protein n=1 Tax=Bradyrhizobium sp. SZCCHNPS1003 TaxID=3057330 RepID=UPI0028E50450|nr:hypothetical protein [Bradyrhizobium sp. SZCCHNPS1003]